LRGNHSANHSRGAEAKQHAARPDSAAAAAMPATATTAAAVTATAVVTATAMGPTATITVPGSIGRGSRQQPCRKGSRN
jgi:activator of HSP90 ATPase